MQSRLASLFVLSAGLGLARVARAGTLVDAGSFTDDTTSGIGTVAGRTGPGVTYGPNDVTVNGVTFAHSGLTGTLPTGVSYALTGTTNQYGSYTPAGISGNVASLGNNFYFDGKNTETLTFTNLTPGQSYQLNEYNFAFGGAGGRQETVTDSDGATLVYDENETPGSILQDSFVAGSNGTFSVSTVAIDAAGDSEHNYDFQLTTVPEPASVGILALGGLVLARRRHA